MNFTKQNNPVVIGALVVILIGALFGVYTQIRHVQTAMAADAAAHKPVPQSTAAPSVQDNSRAILTSYTRPAFSHDPFQQPVAVYKRAVDTSTVHMSRPPILPPTSPGQFRVQPIPVAAPVKSITNTAPAAQSKPASADHTDLNSLRVSAILKGQKTSAIIERDGQPPMSVTEGEKIGEYTVDKIGDDGVVVSDSAGIYTISLAPGAGAQGGTPSQETANVAQ